MPLPQQSKIPVYGYRIVIGCGKGRRGTGHSLKRTYVLLDPPLPAVGSRVRVDDEAADWEVLSLRRTRILARVPVPLAIAKEVA